MSATNQIAVAGSPGLEPFGVFRAEMAGHPLWQYAAFVIYLVLAFAAAWTVNWLLARRLRHLEGTQAAPWHRQLTAISRRPAWLLVFLWIFSRAISVFDWPQPIEVMFRHVCTVIAVIAVTSALFGLIEFLAARIVRQLSEEEQSSFEPMVAMITNVGKVFVVIVAVIVAAQNMSIEVGGLLTTLGVGGIATALAAQDTLANLFGCIVLFADRPFQIGDKIKVETVEGHVERIGLRSTRLRSAEGVLITIPNRTLANATIHNLSRQPGRHD